MRRMLVGLVLVLAVTTLATGVTRGGSAGTLVVTSYGGPWEQFMRREIVPGFESETGAKVELSVGLSRDWVAKIRAAGRGTPPFDVIIANTTWVSAIRKEGFFETLTVDKVPNLKDVWPELRIKDDIGVITLVGPLGIAYRTDLVTKVPKSWKDLWDPAYKGRLGLYSVANSANPMFTMLVSRIYRGNDRDIDFAINKIKELWPFRQTDFSGDMEILLTRGEVHVGILDSPAASRLKNQGVPIEWVFPREGVFMFEQDTNVLAGSTNKELAYRFVNYFLSRPVQEKWSGQFWWTPANRTVRITGRLATEIPVHTQAQIRQIMKWDWDWVNAGAREEMINKWNRVILGR
ncbi:MAG: extracellular solute-binding protein [Armatimonadota bacterium]|nr:extracellular solute-binding protein [Armatimonadota bacterium]